MNYWADRHVLVTGATGFCGAAMVRALHARGAKVTRLVRENSAGEPNSVACSLTDIGGLRFLLAENAIDTVFHFAALSMPEHATADPAGTFSVNVDGTIAVLEACRLAGRVSGVVVASSGRVYGPSDEPCDESAPLNGSTVYDCSKIAAEAACRAYHRNFGVPVAIARFGNLFGPGDPQRERIVPATIDALLAGERPVLLSEGSAERDYLHIDDAVDACLLLAEKAGRPGVAGEAFNIASGRSTSLLDLVAMIAAAAELPDLKPEVRGSRNEKVSRLALSVDRARRVLGWSPAASLEQRLAATYVAERRAAAAARNGKGSPTLFVGIPTMNRPKLVQKTIASVLSQDFTDIRVVVSDNASSRHVAEIVSRFIEGLGDQRISFVAQPENRGEYGQGRYFFNQALIMGARYFMIMHDDDLLDPNYLTRAVAALNENEDAALFVANPRLVDQQGAVQASLSSSYHEQHGRNRQGPGRFNVLDNHMASGFTPISATVFRMSALEEAGLTDPDCHGNFPFECNVMLRLGDSGAEGWFDPETLLSFRYHSESLRNYADILNNPEVVEMMLRIFRRRRYSGKNERRRMVLVSRLHRANALLELRRGNIAGCRAELARACEANRFSPKAWGVRLLAFLAPGPLRASLPEVAPRFSPDESRMMAA